MNRNWISLTAALLAGPQALACTSWSVTQEPLDRVVESEETVRLDTEEHRDLELRHPSATPDTLYGKVTRVGGADSIADAGLALIPYSRVPGTPVALNRSRIVATYIYHAPEGWVETTESLEDLATRDAILRIVVRSGYDLELTNWHADPDSLFGEEKRPELESPGWVGIARSDIDRLSVRRTDPVGTVFAGLGLAAAAVVLVVAVYCLTGDCGLEWNMSPWGQGKGQGNQEP